LGDLQKIDQQTFQKLFSSVVPAADEVLNSFFDQFKAFHDGRTSNLQNFLCSLRPVEYQESYQNGEYSAILDLVRAMSGGAAKESLDQAIDKCAKVVNLRIAIYHLYVRSVGEPQSTQKALNFLERYFNLLMYSQFIKDEIALESTGTLSQRFVAWTKARPELTHLLNNLSLR